MRPPPLTHLVFFLACVQWLLGFFRMGALVILLGLVPTAAAGQINESTKPWLRKVVSWCLALVLYKPIAAIVFAIGFTLMSDGQDLSTVLVGMAVLAMAVIAMPTMLRFFDWGGQRFVSGGGGGGAMAVGAAASMLGGSGAAGLGRFMEHNGPGSGRESRQNSGAVPVSSAHAGDGPGGVGGDSGAAQAAGGGSATGGLPSPAAGGAASSGSVGSAGVTGTAGGAGTAAAGGAAAAAAGPAGAVVAAGQATKDGAVQAVGAAAGAMTDGAPEGSSR